jgi:hypothetical protein
MKQGFASLYREMKNALREMEEMNLPIAVKAEKSYWVAHHSWEKVKDLIDRRGFAGDEEEICFFRDLKPKLCAEMEYFVLLTEVLPFEPADPRLAIAFWKEEYRRLARFMRKHRLFLQYYKSGDHSRDSDYFLRRNCVPDPRLVIAFSDQDPRYYTVHDRILRSYFARIRFSTFIYQRIEEWRGKEKRAAGN